MKCKLPILPPPLCRKEAPYNNSIHWTAPFLSFSEAVAFAETEEQVFRILIKSAIVAVKGGDARPWTIALINFELLWAHPSPRTPHSPCRALSRVFMFSNAAQILHGWQANIYPAHSLQRARSMEWLPLSGLTRDFTASIQGIIPFYALHLARLFCPIFTVACQAGQKPGQHKSKWLFRGRDDWAASVPIAHLISMGGQTPQRTRV